VNLLDENIPLDQRDVLRAWGVHCRVVGQNIAQLSLGDDNILVLLHHLKQPAFFTRDADFFQRELCHPAYGLFWLDVAPEEAALFVRRVLRHPRFATKASRLGIVARAHHDGFQFWQLRRAALQRTTWSDRS
jgi:hypothetical protein